MGRGINLSFAHSMAMRHQCTRLHAGSVVRIEAATECFTAQQAAKRMQMLQSGPAEVTSDERRRITSRSGALTRLGSHQLPYNGCVSLRAGYLLGLAAATQGETVCHVAATTHDVHGGCQLELQGKDPVMLMPVPLWEPLPKKD